MSSSKGSARQEAERLMATVLAMASQGGRGAGGFGALGAVGDAVLGMVGQATEAARARSAPPKPEASGQAGTGVDADLAAESSVPRATEAGGELAAAFSGHRTASSVSGAAECCVCPICRVISTLRDPSPEVAERLATGAGDFATGVTSLLRAFSSLTGADPQGATPASGRRTEDAWASATASDTDPEANVPRSRPAAPKPPAATRTTTGSAATRAVNDDPWAAATASTPPTQAPAADDVPAGAEPQIDPHGGVDKR